MLVDGRRRPVKCRYEFGFSDRSFCKALFTGPISLGIAFHRLIARHLASSSVAMSLPVCFGNFFNLVFSLSRCLRCSRQDPEGLRPTASSSGAKKQMGFVISPIKHERVYTRI